MAGEGGWGEHVLVENSEGEGGGEKGGAFPPSEWRPACCCLPRAPGGVQRAVLRVVDGGAARVASLTHTHTRTRITLLNTPSNHAVYYYNVVLGSNEGTLGMVMVQGGRGWQGLGAAMARFRL